MSSATLVQPRVQKLQCPLVCKPCCTCCAPVPVTWCATFCAARCQPLVQPSVQNLLQPGVLPFVQPGMPRLCKPGIATFGTSCVHFARDAQCDSISAIVDLYDRALGLSVRALANREIQRFRRCSSRAPHPRISSKIWATNR
jgi:hypothetical protein